MAYLKIAEGCDRPCSFCAIPLMRGKHKSTPIEEIVIEAEKLAQKGIKRNHANCTRFNLLWFRYL